ncbi:NAD(P)H dehydrogenase (quinone), partial [Tremellales sp. Uapishka_1]
MYGHIDTLAASVIKGAEATGAIVKCYSIKETLPEEVLSKMYAGGSLKPKYPTITPDDLKEADGIIFGAPTRHVFLRCLHDSLADPDDRYGRLPAQFSQFLDQTGGLWMTGALVGKFATMFTSTASPHGGQEATFLTTFPYFAHQGLIYVPIGYGCPALNNLEVVQGGTPYGASTIAAGDGSKQPTTDDLTVAEYQGKYFSDIVATFVKGKTALAREAESLVAPATAGVGGLALGKVIPAHTTADNATAGTVTKVPSQDEGYAVPKTTETEAVATAPAPAVEAEPVVAAAPVPAATATAAAPVSAVNEKAAATPAAKPKKAGFFASCCGSQKDLEG